MARFNRIKSFTLPLPTTQQHAADAVCGTAVVDAGTLIRIPYCYRGLTWYRSCILCERYHSLLHILTSQLDRSIILALIKGRPFVRIEYHHTRFLGIFSSSSRRPRRTSSTMHYIPWGLALCATAVVAQQYQGNSIAGALPVVPGAEVAFFKIGDPSGFNDELTLVNYYSHGTDGNRIVESKIQRVVIVIPGLLRDCNNYENDVSEAKKTRAGQRHNHAYGMPR